MGNAPVSTLLLEGQPRGVNPTFSLVASQRLRQALLEASVDAGTASVRQHPIDCEIAPQSPAAYWA